MSAEPAKPAAPLPSSKDDVTALITVKKGSRFIPIVLLVVSAAAFIVHGLSSVGTREALDAKFLEACSKVRDTADIANNVGGKATEKEIAAAKLQLGIGDTNDERPWKKTPIAARCAFSNDKVQDLVAEFQKTNLVISNEMQSFRAAEVGGPQGVLIIVAAAVKQYLDAVWSATVKYWHAVISMVVITAVYSLIPGMAGLIYRRAFWKWFGLGFALILAISAAATALTSLLGAGAKSDPIVDAAAGASILILIQVTVLVLAYRVRRHSAKPAMLASIVSPLIYNRVLYWVLIAVAVGTVIDVFGSKALWNRVWAAMPFDDTVEWLNLLILGLPFVYALFKWSDTWSGKARKNIVVCLDGTSNTPDQLDMGFLAQTNVFKLFKMLKADARGSFAPGGRFDATLCKTYGDRQVGLYYTGIGNKFDSDPLIGTLSQATGMGASGIIDRAYLDVLRTWRPGDRVYIFGFSRGAASARILARMISERGAPNSIWTLRLFGRHWSMFPSRNKKQVPINVLGCWDTVGSFGIAKTIGGINFQQLNLLHDMSIPDNVEKAYHLVALDEERTEFEPTLMEPDPIRPDRIVEVWFPGTHAGVGGGFATDRLSDVPLDFILRRVSSGYSADAKTAPGKDESWGIYLSAINGLALTMEAAGATQDIEGAVKIYPDPRGQLRVWISKVYNYRPRKLPLHAVLSETVFDRMKTSEPVYAPQSLFDLNDALDDKRDTIAAKLAKLDETQSLKPGEREAIQTYADKLRLTRRPLDVTAEDRTEIARELTNVAAAA